MKGCVISAYSVDNWLCSWTCLRVFIGTRSIITFSNMYRLNTRAGVLPRSASSHLVKLYRNPAFIVNTVRCSVITWRYTFIISCGRSSLRYVSTTILCLFAQLHGVALQLSLCITSHSITATERNPIQQNSHNFTFTNFSICVGAYSRP